MHKTYLMKVKSAQLVKRLDKLCKANEMVVIHNTDKICRVFIRQVLIWFHGIIIILTPNTSKSSHLPMR